MIFKLFFFNCLFLLIGTVSAQPDLDLIQAVTGFSSPVAIANANDGTNRLFVVERSGVIKIIDDIPTGSVRATPFLNIISKVQSGGERGLLGMAFHPSFPDSPYFFVNYTFTESSQLKTKVERYSLSGDPNVADPLSALQIIEVDQPYDNHNAGDIKFGPDGYLYVTMGDGGSGEDPDSLAQNTMNLLGSMLRLDINGDDFPADIDANYKIPVTNPFVGVPGYREEFWAIGLRNPWRVSFDRTTGDFWIADVGQVSREEVNFQSAASTGGQNYGWSCKEGFLVQNFNECIPGPLTDPVFDYPRGEGRSITGGYVYRGSAFPGLAGYYTFADFATGSFWILNSADFNDVTQYSFFTGITTFGESDTGELYVAHINTGNIYRIVDRSVCPTLVNVTMHMDSVYTSDSLIISIAPVQAGPQIQYFSPQIALEPPFIVENTGRFETNTMSCLEKILLEKF